MSKESGSKEIRSTELSKHKRDGSVLIPPFRQIQLIDIKAIEKYLFKNNQI